jgi:histidinol-phosphate aminotransferase
MIPLDRNESYWLLDDELAEAVGRAGARELSTYPDYTALKDRLAQYAGVSPELLALTAGSDAAIEAIAERLVGNGESALLPVPTFYGYERILERADVQIIPLYYTEADQSFVFPVEETLAAIQTSTARALFLCHPNNPLGCPIPEEALEAMLEAAHDRGIYVVSDEAYFEFSGRTLLPLLDRYPKLIIVRTLSKGFALSGARIGYTIASKAMTEIIAKQLLPWPVSHLSVHAAEALLAHAPAVAARRQHVIDSRASFADSLSRLPAMTVYPSETNFLLVRVPNADEISRILREQGIAVATGNWMSMFQPAQDLLRDVLRIAIPSPDDAPRVLDVLSKV